MLHHAQPTWHFHFLALAASRTVLGLHIQSQCAAEIALGVQSGPWPVSSGRAPCVGTDRGSLSTKPFHAPPAPPAPSHWCLEAVPGSCQSQITLQDPISKQQAPGGHRTLKPTTVPMPHQTQVQHRNPHLAPDSVWHHCALSKWGLFGFSSLLETERRIWWLIWKGQE